MTTSQEGAAPMICADCRFAAHAVLSVVGVGRLCVPCFKARRKAPHLSTLNPHTLPHTAPHYAPAAITNTPVSYGASLGSSSLALAAQEPAQVHTYFGPVPLSVMRP